MPKAEGRGPIRPPYTIISAPDDVHARQRKILSTSFSERAVSSISVHAINRDSNNSFLASRTRAFISVAYRYFSFKATRACRARAAN
jgi:cytochrome P450